MGEEKIFVIGWGRTESRYDPNYHRGIGYSLSGWGKLGRVATVKGGKRIPLGDTYADEKTGYYYLRVDNLSDNGDVTGDMKWLNESTYKALERYRIFSGDLLISIAGTIGRVAVFDESKTNGPTILTENCAKIHLNDDVTPEYMMLLLLSDPLQKQMERDYIQTTIPKLGLDRIRSLRLPKIPSHDVQNFIVSQWHIELRHFAEALKSASALLDSISEYLLSSLGITPPSNPGNTIDNRMFVAHYKEAAGNRLDPHWQIINRFRMGGGRYKNVPLSLVAEIRKGQAFTSADIQNGPYPVIAGGQSSPYSHDEFNYPGNIITVSASGAYAGFVWFHEKPIFASDCSVVFSKDESNILTRYLYEVLHLKQREIYLLQTGSGQPHVYGRDISKISIPIPDIYTQIDLVENIQKIRKKSEDFGIRAKNRLDVAKRRIEAMLLGEMPA